MKTENADPVLEKALKEYNDLISSFLSIQMATVNAEGTPEVSYSPAVIDEEKHFYVFVSEMSAHTSNLTKQKKASVMVIADEATSSQIFARKRVTFACQASEVERDTPRWTKILDLFSSKFGNVVDHIKGMGDFHLIELVAAKGRLVIGFGRAFDVTGAQLDQLEHIKGENGQGHRPAAAPAHGHAHGHAAAAGPAKPMTAADVERIVSHMNEDHSDSIVMYVKHYAKKENVSSAKLSSIDTDAMHITLDSGEAVRIPFEKPLGSAHDAHMTLVEMSKTARKSLEA